MIRIDRQHLAFFGVGVLTAALILAVAVSLKPAPPSFYRAELDNTKVLAEANQGEPVVLMAAWCKVCDAAKAWLSATGRTIRQIDIDTESETAKRLQAHTQVQAVPLLVLEDEILLGFDERAWSERIAAR